MISDDADEVIKNFLVRLEKISKNLQSIRGSEFVFDYVQLLHYKCHKWNLNRGGSYKDSPDWIKAKKRQ